MMGKRSIVGNYVVRKHGVYDFQTAYSAVSTWLNKHGYDFYEKKHTEKDSATGKYMELIWVAGREVSDYVKFHIKVEIWMRNAKPAENGKMHGRVEFIFNSDMETNVDIRGVKKFSPDDEGTFTHFIKDLYEKYIVKAKMEKMEEKLFNETMDFAESVRVVLI
ncbi:MAG: hypothetical protein ABIB71_08950 [Candidatus Woesearchaeota archaeon]